MFQFQTPLPQIPDSDGSPLENGSVYIGTESLNPETSPIVVYWDEDGTIPAAQPLRTSGGFIVRNGSPATVYASSVNYSVTIKDSNGRLVYSKSNSSSLEGRLAASSGSSLVGFIQAGTGAVATTAQTKMRQDISVFDYMTAAQITDVKNRTISLDVTTALATAILANPNATIRCPAGTYKLTSGVTLANGQIVVGDGIENTLFFCTDAFDAFTISSNYAGISDCSFDAASNRTANAYIKISVAIRSNYVRRVKMNYAFWGIWIAADAVITTLEDIEILNCTAATGVGIYINGGNDTFLTRVVTDAPIGSQPMAAVRIQRSQAVWMTDCDFIHCGNGIRIDPTVAVTGLVTWCFFNQVACDSGTGEGLYISAAASTLIKGLYFQNCWFSTNLMGVNIASSIGAIDGIFFNNCTIANNTNRGAWVQGGVNVDFDTCRVSGNSAGVSGTYPGIEYANNMLNFTVSNTLSGPSMNFPASQTYGLVLGTGCETYKITDNNLRGNATGAMIDGSIVSSGVHEVRGNLGYKTISQGANSILPGGTSIVVNHQLGSTPTVVIACPNGSDINTSSPWWVGSFTATTFTITCHAAIAAGASFCWQASLYN